MRNIKIGLLGLGTVGTGVATILKAQAERFASLTGQSIELGAVAVRDLNKPRDILLSGVKITDDCLAVIRDPEIGIVVELMGGVEQPRKVLTEALKLNKRVVTANKALLAEHGEELFELARTQGTSIAFEAAVAGGIPIVANLCQCLSANQIDSIEGILNGTSNFILSQMERQSWTYDQALAEAQRLGFAEADPTLDVDGSDAVQKLAILSQLAFGIRVPWREVAREGIDTIQGADQRFAQELGYRIKLLAVAKRRGDRLETHVTPTLVRCGTPLAEVNDAYNAVCVVGDAVGDVFFQGRGAGRMPTASAVVADILDTVIGRTELTFRSLRPAGANSGNLRLGDKGEAAGRFYLRFTALDRPGVLAEIAGELGKRGISIASLIQHDSEATREGTAPLVIMTHATTASAVDQALKQLEGMTSVSGRCVKMLVRD